MSLLAPRQLFDRIAGLTLGALLVCGALVACAAPQSPSHSAQPAATAPAPAPASATVPVNSTTTPPKAPPSTPAKPPATRSEDPASRVEAPPATPIKIDATCRTNADCTVKNVGNCCGYYPACVNVNSPTDPQGVQAECARTGQVSVCGFREISACQCVKAQCEPAAGGLDVQ